MAQPISQDNVWRSNRRVFLKTTSTLAATGVLADRLPIGHDAHAAGDNVPKIRQIGCSCKNTKKKLTTRSRISFRISINDWMDEARFPQWLEALRRFPEMVDELTLFHSTTHAPLKLDIIRRRAVIMKDRLRVLRDMGYAAGVNVLTTIGHHEEDLPNSISVQNYTPMTNIWGEITKGSFCPNDPRVLAYVRELYRIITEANPDYIWIDDDVRLWHWPCGVCCFCDRCLELFGEEYGRKFSRESLQKAVEQATPEEKLALRKAWLAHNRTMFTNLLRTIEQTVHAIKPGLPLGQMTGDRFVEGHDFDTWAMVLAGPEKAPVMWRPGGGCYRNNNPWEIAQKAISLMRQNASLPSSIVSSIQSEIERLPANRYGKNNAMMILETALFLACDSNGAAINSLVKFSDPMEECTPLFALLQQHRPFFDLLVDRLASSAPIGLGECLGKDSAALDVPGKSGFLVGPPLIPMDEFLKVGFPVTYTRDNRVLTLLTGDSILAEQDKIEAILSGGVYMDVDALNRLNELGYGELTGFAAERRIAVDAIEVLDAHPLNAGLESHRRDCRQGFLDVTRPAMTLKPVEPGTATLSHLIDYTPRKLCDCVMGVYENRLGGRICIAGYYPWTLLYYWSKQRQLQNLFKWLSRETLPAYIASFQRVPIICRKTTDGTLAMALWNAQHDPAEELELMVRTPHEVLTMYDMSARAEQVRATGREGIYQKFVLPRIPAWKMRLIVFEEINRLV